LKRNRWIFFIPTVCTIFGDKILYDIVIYLVSVCRSFNMLTSFWVCNHHLEHDNILWNGESFCWSVHCICCYRSAVNRVQRLLLKTGLHSSDMPCGIGQIVMVPRFHSGAAKQKPINSKCEQGQPRHGRITTNPCMGHQPGNSRKQRQVHSERVACFVNSPRRQVETAIVDPCFDWHSCACACAQSPFPFL
jgi:hypothetical protein